MVYCENDYEEYENYAVNIQAGNYENDLQEALDDDMSDPISSSSVYTDVNSEYWLLTLKLLMAILNLEKEWFKRDNLANSSGDSFITLYIEDVSIICYISNSCSILMND